MMKKIVLILFVGLLAFSVNAQDKAAKIEFKSETVDYGIIEKGSDGVREFEFTNTGDVPLLVSKIKVRCGCTVPSGWSKEPIQAGETSTFSVKFDSKNKPHQQSKTIVVHSNTKKGIDYVKIQLLVTPDPDMEAIRVEKAKQRKEHYRMQKEKAATAQHLSDKNKEIKKSGLEQTDKVDERIALEKDRKKAIEATKDLKQERKKAENKVKILKKEKEKLTDETKKLEKETKKAKKERKKSVKKAKKEVKEAKKKAKRSAKVEKASNAVIARQEKISKLEAKLKKIETKGDLSPNEKLEYEEKISKLNSKLEKEKKVLTKLRN